jgi:beta-ureidopropionase
MCAAAYSRRGFIRNASIGLGAGTLGLPLGLKGEPAREKNMREVWIGTVSTHGMTGTNPLERVNEVLNVLELMVPYQPDIISLPETFAFSSLEKEYKAAGAPADLFLPVKNFAKAHRCYLICPTYTTKEGSIYNTALLIDRNGQEIGMYLKIHPAENELQSGIRPGPMDPPVFDTDFGRIGIQICYDLKWTDGWTRLKQKGAEIIFWPSAYAGGRELCSKAWQNQVFMVSSSRKNTARICDISGEVLAQTGFWQPNYACTKLNLEKACIPTWPYVSEFEKIIQKYKNKIRITTFDEEEWTFLESMDADIRIADILKEYALKTQYQALHDVEAMQVKKRQ